VYSVVKRVRKEEISRLQGQLFEDDDEPDDDRD
ncbi:DNA-binding protein, partial [Escherichia coli]|nr:DNA-binding protein [Escherichia coli]